MKDDANDVAKTLIEGALTAFRSSKSLADKAVAQLTDEKLHIALDENTNSIAVIMKHVAGNLLSRWTDFLTSDGEKPWRDRDDEFIDSLKTRDELMACWESGWQRLFDSLSALTSDDLGKSVAIRGEPHSVPLAIQRSLAHCSYHTGQIVQIARILAGDTWTTLTIPRGASAGFNQRVWGQGHYQTPGPDAR
ncbi:DinB family protein [Aquisphaera insulae]|uniref:DinB family protein n=1 Tax=Aquisphaera insulae TaxID=2712864 RepID=UPI0013EC644F|nr:DinB family protein [Aquisphaera insulae]